MLRGILSRRASGVPVAALAFALAFTSGAGAGAAPGTTGDGDAPLPRSIDLDAGLVIETGVEDSGSVHLLPTGVVVAGASGLARADFDGTLRWHTPGDVDYVQEIVPSPDGRRILARTFGAALGLDADTGEILWRLELNTRSVAAARAQGRGDGARVHGIESEDAMDTRLLEVAIHGDAPAVGWIAARGAVVAVDLDDGTVLDEFTPGFAVERFELRHGDRGPALLVGDAARQVVHFADDDTTNELVRPGQLPQALGVWTPVMQGERFLLGGDRWVYLVEFGSGDSWPLVNLGAYAIETGAVARDAPLLFTADGNDVDVVDLRTTARAGGLVGHRASVREILVSDDGTRALTRAEDRVPRFWDVARNVELARLRGQGLVPVDLDWDRERDRVASVDPAGTVRLWDLGALGRPGERPAVEAVPATPMLTVQRGHTGSGGDLAVSPDGRLLASSSGEEIVLWETEGGRALRRMTVPAGERVVALQFPAPDRILSVELGGFARLWDAATGAELRRVRVGPSAQTVRVQAAAGVVALSHTYDPYVTLLESDGSGIRARVPLEAEARRFGYVEALAVTPDGARLAVGGSDGRVVEYDVASGEVLGEILGPGPARIRELAWAPDGRRLAVATHDRVRIVEAGSVIDEARVGGTWLLEFLDDGSRLVAVGSGGMRSRVGLVDLAADGTVTDVHDAGSLVGGGFTLVSADLLAATTTDGSVLFRSLVDGVDDRRFDNAVTRVDDLRFSADGAELVVATDSRLDHWSLRTGGVVDVRTVPVRFPFNTHGALAADGESLLVADTDTVRLVPRVAQRPVHELAHGIEVVDLNARVLRALPGGDVLLATDRTLERIDPGTGERTRLHQVASEAEDAFERITGVDVSADGARLAVTTVGGRVHLVDVVAGAELARLASDRRCLEYDADGEARWEYRADRFCEPASLPALTPDGRELILVVDAVGSSELVAVDLGTGAVRLRVETGESDHGALALSPDGRRVALAGASNAIQLRDVRTGALLRTLEGHVEAVRALAFSPDGRRLASGGGEGAVRLWDVDSGRALAELLAGDDGRWAVTAGDGRYDAADPGSTDGLFWVLPDEPYRGLPIELFFKDYYEPRLLPRLLAGERFPPVVPLATLNRDQPEIAVAAVRPDPEAPDRLAVDLDVRYATDAPDGRVDAVKLFRDGRLVAQLDAAAVAVGAGGARTLRLDGLQQPSGAAPLEFSAYAFNEDGIKSRTARRTHDRAPVPAGPRRAVIVSIGVNEYENPAWNLFYAGNDARVTQRMLTEALAAAGFDEIVPVLLVADRLAPTVTAMRAHAEAVLRVLGGGQGDPARLAEIDGAERLTALTPDDALFLSFSGHGFADDGRFHFFLHDIGSGASRGVDDALLARTLDSDALSRLVLDIDAGSVAMIIDACNSAASVDAEGFRPGPMGSRGLGQMAYDKRMLVLASSQAEAVAIESAQLRHGMMSYALLREGLEDGRADFDPVDGRIDFGEWARWGVRRVPQIYAEVWDGTFDGGTRGALRVGLSARGDGEDDDRDDDWDDDWEEETPPPQQPSLFDFRTGRGNDVPLAPPAAE